MKNLFDAARVQEVKQQLQSGSDRMWGTMNLAQTLAHCSGALEMALGDRTHRKCGPGE